MTTKKKIPTRMVTRSLKLGGEDLESLKEAADRWYWTSEADILRTAIRVGLKSLAVDPSPLGEPPVPVGYIRAGSEESATAKMTEAGLDTPGTANSLTEAVRAAKKKP